MLSFECDYNYGAHEKILERLCETNREAEPGYGVDEYCLSAKQRIREECRCPNADIFFLVGGTQTNAIVIGSMLYPHEGVISATTGHVNVHEAGAIECTGHKVIELPQHDGKLSASEADSYIENFLADSNCEHMVFPGMLYISHPTEYGTLYTRSELCALHEVAKKYNIPLFMDGARLGYGLEADGTDLTLPDIARLCDVFYIGGTKVGALCGEAVVFTSGKTPAHFINYIKQHGALLAKGRLLGIQFDTLFTDGLYLSISRKAIETANYLRAGLVARNIKMYNSSPTNQQFAVLENGFMKRLENDVRFGIWEKADENHTVVRFATCWATEKADVDALFAAIDRNSL